MTQARMVEPGAPSGYSQVLRHLQEAQSAAEQLGDTAAVALIERLQRLYQSRAGAPDRTPAWAGPAGSLNVYLFGECRAFLNGAPISGWRKKSEALFKYLVIHRTVPVHRDQLLDLFWPEAGPQAARNCLNVTLHTLRRTLEANGAQAARLIHFADEHYRFHPALEIWTDLDMFNEQLARGQALQRASDHAGAIAHYEMASTFYTGDLLEGDRYEDWTINLRERLRISYLALLLTLGQLYAEAGNHTAALECSRKILDRDNCHEDAHSLVMRSYYALGQRGPALRQYQICHETLDRELGVAPMQATIALYEQIKNGTYTTVSVPSRYRIG